MNWQFYFYFLLILILCYIQYDSIRIEAVKTSQTPIAKSLQVQENQFKSHQGAAESIGVRGPHLIWDDLNFNIISKGKKRLKRKTAVQKRKEILKGVSGQAKPGRILAILGPSGSGKTTLLNTLANKLPYAQGNQLTGRISLNNNEDNLQNHIQKAYVKQEQHFYPFLTVRETLELFAALRLGKECAIEDRGLVVQNLVDRLGLTSCADTAVGEISGGEKKRLGIASALVGLNPGSPSLVLLDEPTSGLDAGQAQRVMKAAQDLADDGHTVILSIHQPRSSIFKMFDDLVLLNEGQVMYHGEADKALEYFESLGHKCPAQYNPADFMIDLLSKDITDEKSVDAVNQRTNEFAQKSAEAWRTTGIPVRKAEGELQSALVNSVRKIKSSWFTQFGCLFKRSWTQLARDKFTVTARFVSATILGVVFGSIFWKLGLTETAINSRVSLIANIAINGGMSGCTRALQTFSVENPIIAAERAEEGYGAGAFFLSKLIASFPTDSVFPVIFGPIIYFMSGLHRVPRKIAKFMSLIVLSSHANSALGLMIGCLSPSQDAANIVGPMAIVIFLLLSGVNSDIPPWLKKAEVASTLKWCMEGLLLNEFDGLTFEVKRDIAGKEQKVATVEGFDVLTKMNYKDRPFCSHALHLSSMMGLFHVVTYLSLLKNKPKFQKLIPPANK
mmetsp:Transcript_30046/g.39535  ORF Transcript_30046/g.39535 Transcript_30046/m.39535 type:complete len:673 (+) Transcript_30046:65-2083(+)|eukprot:CAMPEP_0117749216 /NCGR_PEP_ID=MMETSP0947-20121206/9602_1 /TAXON_ID=44440 /ORGANISM="Chattonella subsalsa, Strain CCMP2191" /LENGTH=672 /DNA_ID=CAMNT_0005567073 /DNA_START=64 /DNA_END=2082 /DNA_ORIENTATION=+